MLAKEAIIPMHSGQHELIGRDGKIARWALSVKTFAHWRSVRFLLTEES